MLSEKKQQKIIDDITTSIPTMLFELNNLSKTNKESDVERWCENVFKNCLGFSVINDYIIGTQKSTKNGENMRPDLVIYQVDQAKKSIPIIAVEIKKIGSDLDRSSFRSGKTQLQETVKSLGGIRWGILSNGHQWILIDCKNDGLEICRFDLFDNEENENNEKEKVIDPKNRRYIKSISEKFLNFHSIVFEDNEWENLSKEASAFDPESLAEAILNIDTVNFLVKIIKQEHEYKPDIDSIYNNLKELLIKGLNDAIPRWNAGKESELMKYIIKQKRIKLKNKKTVNNENIKQDIIKNDTKTESNTIENNITPIDQNTKKAS